MTTLNELRYKVQVTEEEWKTIEELVFRCGGHWCSGRELGSATPQPFMYLGLSGPGQLLWTRCTRSFDGKPIPLILPADLIAKLTEIAEANGWLTPWFDMANSHCVQVRDMPEAIQERFGNIHLTRLDFFVSCGGWYPCRGEDQSAAFGCDGILAIRLRPGVAESGERLEGALPTGGAR